MTPTETAFLEEHGLGHHAPVYYGQGGSREVYAVGPDHVLKVQYIMWSGCNRQEWDIWHHVKDTPVVRHLAACYAISDDGGLLLMERVLDHTWGDTPSHVIKSDLLDLGIGACDWGSRNCGMRASTRESVVLDYGCFYFRPGVEHALQGSGV